MPASTVTRTWRRIGAWAFGFMLLSVVVIVVLRLGEIEHFAEIARRAQPLWLAAGAALQALTYVCAAAVWYLVLARAGAPRPLGSLIPLGLAKLFTDQAIPSSGVSGSILVVQSLVHRGVPSSICAAVLLIGLISFYTAYLLAAVASLIILGVHHAIGPAVVAVVAVFSIIAVGVPGGALWLRPWMTGRVRRGVEHFPGFAALMHAVADAPTSLLRRPRLVAETTILQFAIFALDAATLYVMLLAIGDAAAPTAVFASFVIADVAATIAPIPLGLGAFEAVSLAMLHLLGVGLEAALTATLLLRGFTFWLPMLPGLWLVRRELRAA
jgi:uncharacterized membrane protein YbhN (UPF0104 family)